MSCALRLIVLSAGTLSAPIALDYHDTSATLHRFEVADDDPQPYEAVMAFCAGRQSGPMSLCVERLGSNLSHLLGPGLWINDHAHASIQFSTGKFQASGVWGAVPDYSMPSACL